MREATKYNKIMGVGENGEVYVLADTFAYKDEETDKIGFHGATYYSMEPISQETIDAQSDPENLRDIWQEAVRAGQTDLGLEDFAEQLKDEMSDDQLWVLDDTSYVQEFNEALAEASPEVLAKIGNPIAWRCFGCGRLGDPDEKQMIILDGEVYQIAKEAEK